MKKYFSSLALCAVFFFCSLSINAVDFGLVFTQNADATVPEFNFKSTGLNLSGVFQPRFTALFGDKGDLYVSAALNYEADPLSGATPWNGIDSFAIIPELTRTDFAYNFGFADLKIGRMVYGDPLGFIANNLFDGAQVSFITGAGNIRVGGWYTGFLYKKRAAITMTENELESSYSEADYNDFTNSYFAPSRILAAIEYEHPSLAGFIGLNVSLMAQFDMGNDKLNSQYFTAALSVPGRFCILDLGGCLELIEYNNETIPAFAGDVGLTFILPSKLERHIKLSWRYSSGVSEDKTYTAFLPITTVTQGEILEAKLSGLSLLCFDFTGRMSKSVSANMAFKYFLRTDMGTYRSYPVEKNASDGFFLGGEIYGRIIWNISTGVRLNIGTGAFLPSLGDVNPDKGIMWRTNLNLIISIY
jgi:hypothetical protein